MGRSPAFVVAFATLSLLAAGSAGAQPRTDPTTSQQTSSTKDRTKAELTVIKRADLQFGRLVMLGRTGTAEMPAQGLPIYTNLVAVDGAKSAARFEIRGPANRTVQVQLTFPLLGKYGQSGDAKLDGLRVQADFTREFRQDGSLVTLKLDAGGMNAINIGGRLTLAGDSFGPLSILIPVTASITE